MVPIISPAAWVPRLVDVVFRLSKTTKLTRELNSIGRGRIRLLPAPSPVLPGTGTVRMRFVVLPWVIEVEL
jgi:hypothetical protein